MFEQTSRDAAPPSPRFYRKVQDFTLARACRPRNQKSCDASLHLREITIVVEVTLRVPDRGSRRCRLNRCNGRQILSLGPPDDHSIETRRIQVPASGSAETRTHTVGNPKWSTMVPIAGESSACISP